MFRCLGYGGVQVLWMKGGLDHVFDRVAQSVTVEGEYKDLINQNRPLRSLDHNLT